MNVNESARAFGSAFLIEIGFISPTSTIRARGGRACIASVSERWGVSLPVTGAARTPGTPATPTQLITEMAVDRR
jgi:hypothetical protein